MSDRQHLYLRLVRKGDHFLHIPVQAGLAAPRRTETDTGFRLPPHRSSGESVAEIRPAAEVRCDGHRSSVSDLVPRSRIRSKAAALSDRRFLNWI